MIKGIIIHIQSHDSIFFDPHDSLKHNYDVTYTKLFKTTNM